MNMFPSSTSSSSQGSMGPNGSNSGGLLRYGSAPSSVLTTAVDSVLGAPREFASQKQLTAARFFPSEASESTAKPSLNDNFSARPKKLSTEDLSKAHTAIGLQQSYGGAAGPSSSSLIRQSSSPAGFLNHLATAAGESGFSITRGIGSSYNSKGLAGSSHGVSTLKSQLSFTRPKEALSRISEETENITDGIRTDNFHSKSTHYASAGFGMGSWDDTSNLTFSVAPTSRTKTIPTDVSGLDNMESQFQFGMSQATLEMATTDKLLHIPQDSVPCKIRAKRGCATHPRSIAERERRTRISRKLKKLQDIVPNMDKQTSYADMLELAVQHIKNLQNQVQKLNKEFDGCTCGCKKSSE